MKIYIVATVIGQHMYGTSKPFLTRSGAEKYMEKQKNKDILKILVADNWHEEVD